MKNNPLVSIIITNYNYGRFLKEAIESALNQDYSDVEVIVVDDGSTDNSIEVIEGFNGKIIKVLKPNGGQASAFNAGFGKSRGDIIIFLDSDDALLPSAVTSTINSFKDENVAKVHWHLYIMNEYGVKTQELFPKDKMEEGNFREKALQSGPPYILSPPTSGNAWSRKFIDSVIPVPEDAFRICADEYFVKLVTFFGSVKQIDEPQSFYRIHEKNNYHNNSSSENIQEDLKRYYEILNLSENYCEKLGLKPNSKSWKINSPFINQEKGIQEMVEQIPENNSFIFVDDANWALGNFLKGRTIYPFLENNNCYFGPPADDATAILELERMREKGANYIVFAQPSFWWLDHFTKFKQYLIINFRCTSESELLIIFSLNAKL